MTRIIIINLIILILKLIYAEAKNINNNLNKAKLENYDFNININDNKNFKLINNNDEQFSQQEDKEFYPPENDYLLPFESRTGYLIVMISSYLAVYLNFVGTGYVLYRSYIRWRNGGTPLPMTLRVPMYIALTDSFFMINHLVNITHMAATQKPWEGSSCKIIGGLAFFFQCLNIFLVGGVAITTFLRVKRGRFFSLGKYDYKLFTGMLILSSVSTVIFNQNYGPNKYWCAGEFSDKNLAIFSLCIISVVTTVSLFCYISIIREMRSIKIDECFNTDVMPEEISNQRKETNKRIYSKISSYILIFIIQYVPVTIYNIGHIIHVEHYWVYVVCDIGINFGGIGNFVQYTINEGWSDKSDDSSTAYGLNITNYRHPRGSYNFSSNSRNLNQEFDEVVDSFGIIRPSTAEQKTNKKGRSPRLKTIPDEISNS